MVIITYLLVLNFDLKQLIFFFFFLNSSRENLLIMTLTHANVFKVLQLRIHSDIKYSSLWVKYITIIHGHELHNKYSISVFPPIRSTSTDLSDTIPPLIIFVLYCVVFILYGTRNICSCMENLDDQLHLLKFLVYRTYCMQSHNSMCDLSFHFY